MLRIFVDMPLPDRDKPKNVPAMTAALGRCQPIKTTKHAKRLCAGPTTIFETSPPYAEHPF